MTRRSGDLCPHKAFQGFPHGLLASYARADHGVNGEAWQLLNCKEHVPQRRSRPNRSESPDPPVAQAIHFVRDAYHVGAGLCDGARKQRDPIVYHLMPRGAVRVMLHAVQRLIVVPSHSA